MLSYLFLYVLLSSVVMVPPLGNYATQVVGCSKGKIRTYVSSYITYSFLSLFFNGDNLLDITVSASSLLVFRAFLSILIHWPTSTGVYSDPVTTIERACLASVRGKSDLCTKKSMICI